jgi:hypothetical protein
MMMGSRQDKPDDKVAVADGLELMRAFRRIASADDRRKVIEVAQALARKPK